MTLRLRLMLILGLSFSLLWGAASVWMLLDLKLQFRDALDERLAASARMVGKLVAGLPDVPASAVPAPGKGPEGVALDGVACEVRLLRGDLIARTHDSPVGLGLVRSGFSTRTINGELWRSYTLEQGGKRITTADRVSKRDALLRNMILATVVPFLIAMAGSLVVLWFGIRQGLVPLEAIRRALAERKPDVLHPLPTARLPAELAPLVQTINRLLGLTQNAIDRERRFTGDAAHELRTPLTAIKTHLQVARITADAETGKALENAEEGVQRLQHTLEQLLMLARVEGPFSFEGEEAASARDIAEGAINAFPAVQRQRLVIEQVDGQRKVVVPRSLAITAVRNLLDNALRYSPQESTVMVCLSAAEGMACFSVVNAGPRLSDEKLAHAVQRFWRQGESEGSGLGLSIVDAIVKRFGGSVHLQARPDGGVIAEIRLPAQ